jgi:hypothetical protein
MQQVVGSTVLRTSHEYALELLLREDWPPALFQCLERCLALHYEFSTSTVDEIGLGGQTHSDQKELNHVVRNGSKETCRAS